MKARSFKKWLAPMIGLFLVFSLSSAQAQGASGKDLIKRLNCHACHAQAGRGGNLGPGWDGMGQRLSPEAIRRQIVSPQKGMPNFAHLSPEELQAVVDCLSGMK